MLKIYQLQDGKLRWYEENKQPLNATLVERKSKVKNKKVSPKVKKETAL